MGPGAAERRTLSWSSCAHALTHVRAQDMDPGAAEQQKLQRRLTRGKAAQHGIVVENMAESNDALLSNTRQAPG